MSRRRDRERFADMKCQNPQYRGFRGHAVEHTGVQSVALHSMTCSLCGRKRNVPVEDATGGGGEYICLSCRGS